MEKTITRIARMNSVVLTGNVGDAKNIYKNEKGTMAAFSFAHYQGKDAEGNDQSAWVDVKVFNNEKTPNNLSLIEKGQKLIVKGRLTSESFTRKDGTPGSKLIIVAESIELNTPVTYVAVDAQGKEEDLPTEEF